jgi:exodeoxyribonuclease VII large subunit
MEQYSLGFDPGKGGPEPKIYTLRELSDGIRGALERQFTNIRVAGEISGSKLAPSGHCYFTLKDTDAQIKCVCWKLTFLRLRFKPQDGLKVIVRGRIDIYEQRSEYQFTVEAIEPRGFGALQLAFEQLKQRLLEEGLFEAARKRELPRYPRRIGLITSPHGAVIRDFLQILDRRFPGLHVRVFPARVQGAGSVEDLTRALRYFGDTGWADVVVLARGGGSLEDLWTFNEEAVARAIASCRAPVVSAIGHETDVTIADFVADLRAPTPSAAAELVVCTRQELLERIGSLDHRALQRMRLRFAVLARRLRERGIERATSLLQRAVGRRMQRVDDSAQRIPAAMRTAISIRARRLRDLDAKLRYFDLRPRLGRDRQRLQHAHTRLAALMQSDIASRRERAAILHARMAQLNPRLVLARGYAIVLDEAGGIVKRAAGAPEGTGLKVLFAENAIRARVMESPAE